MHATFVREGAVTDERGARIQRARMNESTCRQRPTRRDCMRIVDPILMELEQETQTTRRVLDRVLERLRKL